MTPAGFEPTIPESERQQNYALDRLGSANQSLGTVIIWNVNLLFKGVSIAADFVTLKLVRTATKQTSPLFVLQHCSCDRVPRFAGRCDTV